MYFTCQSSFSSTCRDPISEGDYYRLQSLFLSNLTLIKESQIKKKNFVITRIFLDCLLCDFLSVFSQRSIPESGTFESKLKYIFSTERYVVLSTNNR